jgi:hypothetical protein
LSSVFIHDIKVLSMRQMSLIHGELMASSLKCEISVAAWSES